MADQPESMFNNDSGSNPPNNEPNSVDKLADLLKSIKNENGEQKYSSLEKALEALSHSQSFIPQIKSQLTEREQELERVKAELQQRASLEDTVQRLIAKKAEEDGTPPTVNGLDEQAVMKLVQSTLSQTELERQTKSNMQKVQDVLGSKFGEKAGDMVKQKAAELGTTPEELGKLAAKNPNMVLAYFNTMSPRGSTPTVGSVHIPPLSDKPKLERPTKSLLSGATSREQLEFLNKIKEHVYAERGID